MNPNTAARVLMLKLDDAAPETVKAAFSKAARGVHPDTTEGQTQMASELLKNFKQARDVLLEELAKRSEFVDCDLCDGTGKMKTRRGALIKCSRCGGAGQYKPRRFARG